MDAIARSRSRRRARVLRCARARAITRRSSRRSQFSVLDDVWRGFTYFNAWIFRNSAAEKVGHQGWVSRCAFACAGRRQGELSDAFKKCTFLKPAAGALDLFFSLPNRAPDWNSILCQPLGHWLQRACYGSRGPRKVLASPPTSMKMSFAGAGSTPDSSTSKSALSPTCGRG